MFLCLNYSNYFLNSQCKKKILLLLFLRPFTIRSHQRLSLDSEFWLLLDIVAIFVYIIKILQTWSTTVVLPTFNTLFELFESNKPAKVYSLCMFFFSKVYEVRIGQEFEDRNVKTTRQTLISIFPKYHLLRFVFLARYIKWRQT